jgi:hypothetical protein
MGRPFNFISYRDGNCALSVQKINLILGITKQLYIPENPLLARVFGLYA